MSISFRKTVEEQSDTQGNPFQVPPPTHTTLHPSHIASITHHTLHPYHSAEPLQAIKGSRQDTFGVAFAQPVRTRVMNR